MHKLFENTFIEHKKNTITKENIHLIYKSIIKNFIEELFIMNKSEIDMDKEFDKYINDIYNFFNEYITMKKTKTMNEKSDEKIRIIRVVETESMIIMNNFGLKGQLDAILYCEITKENEIKNVFIPFELKTGKEYFLHFYQV